MLKGQCHGYLMFFGEICATTGLSKRLRVAREMEKVTGDISHFRFSNACKIELRTFREAGTFITVDGEMRRLPANFDNPGYNPVVNVIKVLHLYFTRVAIVSLAENNSCTYKLQV